MEDVVKIGCPKCGAVLSVQKMPGLETKHVTCPVCKNKAVFTSFRKIVETDEGTQPYTIPPGANGESFNVFTTPGMLVGPGVNYRLKIGRNVIGRKSSTNEADCGIPCGEEKRMSRQHIIINVVKKEMGFEHQISLFKERVNPTYVGISELVYGDTILLQPHDVIRLPGYELSIVPDDPELTEG